MGKRVTEKSSMCRIFWSGSDRETAENTVFVTHLKFEMSYLYHINWICNTCITSIQCAIPVSHQFNMQYLYHINSICNTCITSIEYAVPVSHQFNVQYLYHINWICNTCITSIQYSIPVSHRMYYLVSRTCCSRTFLVHPVELLLGSVTGGSKPSVINCTVNFHLRNR